MRPRLWQSKLLGTQVWKDVALQAKHVLLLWDNSKKWYHIENPSKVMVLELKAGVPHKRHDTLCKLCIFYVDGFFYPFPHSASFWSIAYLPKRPWKASPFPIKLMKLNILITLRAFVLHCVSFLRHSRICDALQALHILQPVVRRDKSAYRHVDMCCFRNQQDGIGHRR